MTNSTGAYASPAYLQDAVISHSQEFETIFRPFIEAKMTEFSAYDAQRPEGHVYAFDAHVERVASTLKDFALSLGWSADIAETLYWASLPHDIGKMSLPVHIWDSEDKPTAEDKALRRTHVTEGLKIIDEAFAQTPHKNHPFLNLLREIMENHHEALDGSGLFGKTADDLNLISRMSCICDSFDGWSVWRPHFGDRDISPLGVITRMETEKDGQFDKELLKLFKDMKLAQDNAAYNALRTSEVK